MLSIHWAIIWGTCSRERIQLKEWAVPTSRSTIPEIFPVSTSFSKKAFDTDLPVNEHADEDGVKHGDRRRLRGREDAPQDPPENDDRHHQRQHGVLGRIQRFPRTVPAVPRFRPARTAWM